MMNPFSRSGRTAKALQLEGRTFHVCSVTATQNELQDKFPVDEEGVVLVHTTIDAAIAAASASRGDTIYVYPGHTEAVTNGSLDLDKAGITIIGLGVGAAKPTLSFGATSSRINVTAANCKMKNFRFTAAVGDVVTAVLHATAAQNTRYLDIEFYATPFLFPISEYRFPYGVSWGNTYYMIINYSALILVWGSIVIAKIKNRKKAT